MKILVTGAAGLIGSHLCDELLSIGCEVVGVDNLSYGNKKNLPNHENFRFLGADCTEDFWRLSKTCMCEVSCDCDLSGFHYVFHLASAKKTFPSNTEIELSQVNTSSWVMENNSKMIRSVVKFVEQDKSKLIFTSTSDVYGHHETFKESGGVTFDTPDIERQTYSLTKFFEEQYLLNKFNEGTLSLSIVRVFGCFSERSNSNGWSGGHVPFFIKKALNGEDIVIHGDGQQTRSMAYVGDIVNGLVSIMDNFDVCNGDIINLGTDEEMSVLKHAQWIQLLTKSKSKIVFIDEEKAHGKYKDVRRRKPNLEKAKNLLGYSPKVSFENALNKVLSNVK
jgi:UDP-glucose 4-epimerase